MSKIESNKYTGVITGIITLAVIRSIGYNSIPLPVKICLLLISSLFMLWFIISIKRPRAEQIGITIIGIVLILGALLSGFAIIIEKTMPSYNDKIHYIIGILLLVILLLLLILSVVVLMIRRKQSKK
jgi:hypothetical protein